MTTDPRLQSLADWLSQAAHPLGLTNYASAQEMLTRAILPAAALPALLGAPLSGAWAEMGPGSGALGLALAVVAPAACIELLDRRQRVTAFLDLTIRRFALQNAAATTLSLPSQGPHRYLGVVFRAFARPTVALQTAREHSRRWVCAWHTPGLDGYDHPPLGLSPVARSLIPAAGLAVTLYRCDPCD